MADPRTTAASVKGPIGVLGGGFMISREAKAICEQYELGPRELYFRGRCGVIGETHADVIMSIAHYFPADHVVPNWEGGRKIPVEQAVALYAGICQDWGRRRLGGLDGCARIAALLERVVEAASPLAAPLFAGWRAVPLADDAPARAAQLLHVVRELRGGLHTAAVIASGLTPLEATLSADHSGTPFGNSTGEMMAKFFEWPEPYPTITPEVLERRREVEERTDDLMAPSFEVLTETERDELIELLRLGHAR
ncbi:hypothetical protein ACIBH1_05110 [Nonomuraea sp. NPDC050663]|uniref:SCO6745 family protein n=1 Tax=Nonomuraea sp. NPDC050663 TaxID=3364370 RepID=UPI003796B1E5